MDTPTLVLAMAVIAAAVVLTLTPLALSWPRRVRWLVRAQTVDLPWAGISFPPADVREVMVVSVDNTTEQHSLHVLEVARAPGDAIELICPSHLSDAEAERLREWGLLRTPLLLFVEGPGGTVLGGPTAAIGHLSCRVAPVSRSARA